MMVAKNITGNVPIPNKNIYAAPSSAVLVSNAPPIPT